LAAADRYLTSIHHAVDEVTARDDGSDTGRDIFSDDPGRAFFKLFGHKEIY
jgi:hypothetical protein